MPRPTPVLNIKKDDVISLKAIIENSPADSRGFKRASVVLACREGIQCKEIAKQFSVTPNMVTNWRRKFEQGGVDGLMADEPRPGRCGSSGVPVVVRVEEALTTDPPNGDTTWTSATLSEHLGIPLSSVQRALQRLDVVLERRHTWSVDLPAELQQKHAEIMGLYLSESVQILAMALSTTYNANLLSSGQLVTVNSSAVKCLQQTKESNGELALSVALRSIATLDYRRAGTRKAQNPASYLESLCTSLIGSGADLYIVLNAPDPKTVVNGLPITVVSQQSVEDFMGTAGMWFRALEGEYHTAEALIEGVKLWMDKATEECEPFVWRMVRTQAADTDPTPNSASSMPDSGNVLTVSLEYKDSQGNTLRCTKEFVNTVPNLREYSESSSIGEYTELVGQLEQGLIKSVKETERAFMDRALSVEASNVHDDNLKKNTQNHTKSTSD